MTNGFVGGYRIDLENLAELRATQTSFQRMLSVGDTPERVDPRRSSVPGFLPVEDQLAIGSCAGNALADVGEMAYTIATGQAVQLSRMFAYIAAQIVDNINGDNGSTISAGTKVAREGICSEVVGPYPRTYPGRSYITQAMLTDRKNYILQSHTEIKQEPDARGFLGSGAGGIQIGISWGNEMTPDANGCIRRFTGAGGGGHSVGIVGYVPDADIGQRSTKGYWYLLKNSWGTRWGIKGYAYVDPAAIAAMLKHRFTAFFGRSDLKTPQVRTLPYDFTKGKVIQI
jgi:C1A family cysteine protease